MDALNSARNKTQSEQDVGCGCRKLRIGRIVLSSSWKGKHSKDGVNSTTESTTAHEDIRSGPRQAPSSEVKVRFLTMCRDDHEEDNIGEIVYSKNKLSQAADDLNASEAVEADVDEDCKEANGTVQPDTAEINADLHTVTVQKDVTVRKYGERQDRCSSARLILLFSIQLFMDKDKWIH